MQQYADIYSLQSSFAMNKYLHTVASVGFLFTFNYDAWNHELKKNYVGSSPTIGVFLYVRI